MLLHVDVCRLLVCVARFFLVAVVCCLLRVVACRVSRFCWWFAVVCYLSCGVAGLVLIGVAWLFVCVVYCCWRVLLVVGACVRCDVYVCSFVCLCVCLSFVCCMFVVCCLLFVDDSHCLVFMCCLVFVGC